MTSTKQPFIVFISGASGAGKTSSVKALDKTLQNSVECLFFDNIGVPSIEEMIEEYGSDEGWQQAMTEHWLEIILKVYQDKDCVILEGQMNLDFIFAAIEKLPVKHYQVILFDCENTVRHERLKTDRNQPDLVNAQMDTWAAFLRKQAIERKVPIIDTSHDSLPEIVERLRQIILA